MSDVSNKDKLITNKAEKLYGEIATVAQASDEPLKDLTRILCQSIAELDARIHDLEDKVST